MNVRLFVARRPDATEWQPVKDGELLDAFHARVIAVLLRRLLKEGRPFMARRWSITATRAIRYKAKLAGELDLGAGFRPSP